MQRPRYIRFCVLALVIAACGAFVRVPAARADDLQAQIDADNQQIAALNEKIAQYQAQLQQLGADKKTLQAAISSLDLQRSKVKAQVAATQRKIDASQLQIQQLNGQLSDTEQHIATDREALGRYLLAVQQADSTSLAVQLFSADSLSAFFDGMQQTLQVQTAIQQRVDSLTAQEEQLARTQSAVQAQKDTLASQQQDLASQQQNLTATEKSKTQLLAQTKSQEATYQKLLQQAQAELESYSAFVQNAGGAGLLGNQTVCDAWGCYYNQRDSAWGSASLNGTKYTLASDGCLVTSMAMVLTHYGYRNVTPVTINSNPTNFASYYPAFLMSTIYVRGITATRVTTAIDATLATGNPVVVGLKAYGGTHFVVLISGSGGHYVMRDPYLDDGKDVSFTDHYTVRSIYSIAKVVITS